MFGIFKRKKSEKLSRSDEAEHASANELESPKWYEIGDGNPFNERILDMRSIALNIVATTREKSIAEN